MTRLERHLIFCRSSEEYKPTFEGARHIKTKMTHIGEWPGVDECELWRCNLCGIIIIWIVFSRSDERESGIYEWKGIHTKYRTKIFK